MVFRVERDGKILFKKKNQEEIKEDNNFYLLALLKRIPFLDLIFE